MDHISRLCAWYESQTYEDWHEDYGIKIYNIDNPGWGLVVDLEHTSLENKNFVEMDIERSDTDWIAIRKSDGKFNAYGGPNNLKEMIDVFLEWSSST